VKVGPQFGLLKARRQRVAHIDHDREVEKLCGVGLVLQPACIRPVVLVEHACDRPSLRCLVSDRGSAGLDDREVVQRGLASRLASPPAGGRDRPDGGDNHADERHDDNQELDQTKQRPDEARMPIIGLTSRASRASYPSSTRYVITSPEIGTLANTACSESTTDGLRPRRAHCLPDALDRSTARHRSARPAGRSAPSVVAVSDRGSAEAGQIRLTGRIDERVHGQLAHAGMVDDLQSGDPPLVPVCRDDLSVQPDLHARRCAQLVKYALDRGRTPTASVVNRCGPVTAPSARNAAGTSSATP
jgi:hypothetical protein